MANLEDGILAFENGDYVAAFKEFWVLAEQGSVNAQFNIGTMYLHGQGVDRSWFWGCVGSVYPSPHHPKSSLEFQTGALQSLFMTYVSGP